METYSLFQLNEYLRRVIALNFSEHIWINAELLQISESRGNYYVELIEKQDDSDVIIAQSSAVIWYRTYLSLKKKLGGTLASLLKSGVEVKIKIKVDYNERYGMKLVIDDIDPNFTLGKLELERQRIIERLQKEALIGKNNQIKLPTICQSLAIISSSSAAGYQDFIQQLNSNSYGFKYRLELFQSAMQGKNTKADVVAALRQISDRADEFDCVVIVRGGGSKLDLSGFDDYDICLAIANANIPIITGIGHDIDNGLADLVSHTNVKTPTAAADFFIERHMIQESRMVDVANSIFSGATELIQQHQDVINRSIWDLEQGAQQQVNQEEQVFQSIVSELKNISHQKLKEQEQTLASADSIFTMAMPQNVMKRGYARIKHHGKYVAQSKNLKPNDELVIELESNEVLTIVKSIK